ncbi:MAG: multidrug ABC transporter permease [Bacteroidetes bacterium HGW-Bacteroidetes-6]|jgi:ABC-2 type transport system permease protein|nr:MAG: multidrug ABC transporter permease [Bacteroidetes bacterium HGW-Bacteroidetes-6]
MKQFLGFFRKEFIHIIRDFRSLLILLLMPVVMMMIFGYAINMDVKDADIAVLDMSKDDMTKQITDKILSSGYFRLYQNIGSREEVETLFRSGKVKEAILFEPGFARKFTSDGKANIQIIADASDPNNANMLVNYTNGIISNYQLQKSSGGKLMLTTESRFRYNENLESVYMFVPGLIALLVMLISTMMTSISIAREKETGTMEIILVSPLKPWQIIIGKVAPYAFIALCNLAVILLLGTFMFGVPYRGSMALLLAVCVLFIMMALSLGILISTISSNQLMAMMISMIGLLLPTILLSGYIFPIENMPRPLQMISSVFPARYFITVLKAVMLKGVGIAYVWKEIVVLSGMLVLFLGVSIRKFKIRLG